MPKRISAIKEKAKVVGKALERVERAEPYSRFPRKGWYEDLGRELKHYRFVHAWLLMTFKPSTLKKMKVCHFGAGMENIVIFYKINLLQKQHR